MSVRLCVAIFPRIFEVSPEGKFSGFFFPLFDTFTSSIRKIGNISFTTADKLGDMDPKTELFDGCLGQMQRNESDIHFPPIKIPHMASGLQYGYVGSSSKVMIGTVYNSNLTNSNTGVMDAFFSFSAGTWLHVFAIIALLALLILSVYALNLMTAVMRRHKS